MKKIIVPNWDTPQSRPNSYRIWSCGLSQARADFSCRLRRRAKSGIIVIFMILISAMAPKIGYCDGDLEIKTVEGAISALDWVGSKITVREINSVGDISYRDLVITVPPDMEIVKDSDTITPDDLEIGDQVTVEYSKDKDGALKAQSIIVSVQ